MNELPPTDLIRKAATSMDMRYEPEDFDAWYEEEFNRISKETLRVAADGLEVMAGDRVKLAVRALRIAADPIELQDDPNEGDNNEQH